jgi:predicted phage terminase large subunit-like protein
VSQLVAESPLAINRARTWARARRAELEAEALQRRREEQAEVTRGRCVRLAGFVKEAWAVLEPKTPLVWNWHLDALCEHLEAVTAGRINRLLVNVPPGSSKSLIVSVMWQAWEWGPKGLRSHRFLSTAFNDGPVKRDTRKTRDLILSDWYRTHWPAVTLNRVGETSFGNTDTGTREGIAFGSLTSQRGDRLIIDDPHSTETAESDVERATTTRKFREGATDRLNDQARSAIVVIMQRLHSHDVSGTILEVGMEYVHLCLPMEFEVARACSTEIGFSDPRTKEGELLDPVRWPPAEVEKLKRDKGSYAYAGQYQQRPVPRAGGMFQREWLEGHILHAAPEGTIWVRYWDLAGTELKKKAVRGARTAGVKMGRAPDGRFIVGHMVAAGKEGRAVKKLVKDMAEIDGKGIEVHLSQDPGQAGKTQALDYIDHLAGWVVRKHRESGDKIARADPLSSQAEGGNLWLIEGPWNKEYIDEVCLFPGGPRKDLVDASSGAFGVLLQKTAHLNSDGLAAPEEIGADDEDDDEPAPPPRSKANGKRNGHAPPAKDESELVGYD